jgi:hypothetical protein
MVNRWNDDGIVLSVSLTGHSLYISWNCIAQEYELLDAIATADFMILEAQLRKPSWESELKSLPFQKP